MDSEQQGVEQQPQAQPQACSNGCGFFANGASGLCSKCSRESELAQQKLDAVTQKCSVAVARAASHAPALTETPEPVAESSAAGTEPSIAAPSGTQAPSSNPCRCTLPSCHKKLGLTGFKCKCGFSFCGQHRHAEGHACSFDYKAYGRTQIADNNPVIQASKVQKI